MIFLRSESFREYIKMYPITSILLLVNVILFILMFITGGSNHENLIRFGALVNFSPYDDSLADTWRYFSSMFLHIGLDHLLFNGFALFIFAPPLERILGHVKFFIVYIGSGLAGNLFSMMLLPVETVSAGASGAIYGIFGAFIFMMLYRKNMLDEQSAKTIQIMLVIGIIYSVVYPGINVYAHLGGFVGGFLLFALFHKAR